MMKKQKLTHERFMIASGAAFGGIFAGFAIHGSGNWRWAFGMNSILTGVMFLLIFFFLPETNFRRPVETEVGDSTGTDDEPAPKTYNWIKSLAFWGWYDRWVILW